MFKVNEFLGEINKRGFARNNAFTVDLRLPEKLNTTDIARSLRLRADTTDLPGKVIQTSDYRTDYGPQRKIGFMVGYLDINISFILSENMQEKAILEEWQSSVVSGGSSNFEVGYYHNYATDITLSMYSVANDTDPVFSMTLFEAYPVTVNPVGLSWEQNEAAKISAQFAYRHHNMTVLGQVLEGEAQTSIFTRLNQLGIGGGLGTIGGILLGDNARLATAVFAGTTVIGRVRDIFNI